MAVFCAKCGSELMDEAVFCPKCGQQIGQPIQQAQQSGQVLQPQTGKEQAGAEMPAPFPMKWHKFKIYFELWLLGGSSIWYGIWHLENKLLEACISGIILIMMGLFAIWTRFSLAKFKKRAPKMVLGVYGCDLAYSGMWHGLWYFLTKEGFMEGDPNGVIGPAIAVALVFILLMVANHVYYKKRAGLFVNK